MERDRTIQMKMPGDWLALAEDEANLLFGGNRSEMVRFSVLLLRHLRSTDWPEYTRLRRELSIDSVQVADGSLSPVSL